MAEAIGNRFILLNEPPPRKGGMAEVHKAFDLKSQQLVAVKLFSDEVFKDRQLALEAFARESKSLYDLNGHPNIAAVIDCGTDPVTGQKYIALEWLNSCAG